MCCSDGCDAGCRWHYIRIEMYCMLIGIDVLFSTVAGDAIARTRPMSSIVSGEGRNRKSSSDSNSNRNRNRNSSVILDARLIEPDTAASVARI